MGEDGNLCEEITRRIQSGWRNWKMLSGVLCERKLRMWVKEWCTRLATYEAETLAAKKA